MLTALSHQNARAILSRIAALTEAGDADFSRGADEAAIVQFYGMGILKNEGENPIVQRATAFVKAAGTMGATDMRTAIGGAMVTVTLMREVKERFDIS